MICPMCVMVCSSYFIVPLHERYCLQLLHPVVELNMISQGIAVYFKCKIWILQPCVAGLLFPITLRCPGRAQDGTGLLVVLSVK